MFPLHLNSKMEKCFHGLVKIESWKWHLRLGHLNFSGLKLFLHQAWCMNCLVLKSQNMYVRYALLASNKEVLFQVGDHGEHLTHQSQCARIFAVHLIQFLLEVTNISSPLLMISAENYGFILSKENLQLSLYSKVSRHMLKWKVVVRSKYLDLTEVVSTPQMNFKIIAGKMACNNLQLHTHHSKMALQKEKVE